MKQIPLTQGKFALVDDADLEWLSQYKWRIHKKPGGRFYARTSIKINGVWKTVGMHQLIMGLPEQEVDHRNRNGLDNQRCNLRECSRSHNQQNTIRPGGTSSFKGVSWQSSRRKWLAAICVNQKRINLGRYINEIDAAKAYDEAAKLHFGENALTNFKGQEHGNQITQVVG
jgi:hypothetical protein